MVLKPCTDSGCGCYTSFACSGCKHLLCPSHLHPIALVPGVYAILCETCFRQPDATLQSALNRWRHQDTDIPPLIDLDLCREEPQV